MSDVKYYNCQEKGHYAQDCKKYKLERNGGRQGESGCGINRVRLVENKNDAVGKVEQERR